jgi:endonuclease/exonuclease/phosphatase family metal-dependent hydrolase
MLRKHRDTGALKTLGPLMASKLRQRRKAYANGDAREDDVTALVASYNIHKCVGLDRRFNPERIMAVISEIGADVIALQEVDQRFGARAGLLDLEALERDSGLCAVPLDGTRNNHGWRGNLVLVRNGTVDGVRQIVLPGAEPRGALVVDVTLAAGPLRIIAAHLGLLRRSRARQIRAILAAAETEDGRPAVLMGDLNEWRLGKRSSLQALDPTFGPLGATVASFPSRFPVWSLDRILANPHELVSRIDVHNSPLAQVASDHLPIKAVLRLAQTERPEREGAEMASAA